MINNRGSFGRRMAWFLLAVLLVTAQLNPADRVRATLAGIKAPLTKPVSRGDVARALESCGVTLPADARRG